MYKRVLGLGMVVVSLFWGVGAAQQPELSALSIGKWDRWQADVISLFGEGWYFRVTVGALANIRGKLVLSRDRRSAGEHPARPAPSVGFYASSLGSDVEPRLGLVPTAPLD